MRHKIVKMYWRGGRKWYKFYGRAEENGINFMRVVHGGVDIIHFLQRDDCGEGGRGRDEKRK